MSYYRITDCEGKLKDATLEEWAKWFDSKDRIIGKTFIGDILVSTICLGINHGYLGKVLWFETMIFSGEFSEFQERYETFEEAKIGHEEAVRKVMG